MFVDPSAFPPGSREFVTKPSQMGMEDYEEVSFSTPDGLTLHGTSFFYSKMIGVEVFDKLLRVYYLPQNQQN